MKNRELAGKLRALLTPQERWWDGKSEWYQGKSCLGQALGQIVPSYFGPEYHRISGIAEQLFPEKAGYDNIPWFNDHADYADVMRVIDRLEETPDD